MVPILLGLLLSYAISNALAMSVYDVILEMKNLPFLASLSNVTDYNKTAKDLMNENFLYLTKESRLSHISVIMNQVQF